MLRKTTAIDPPIKKRVHWDESVVNNEGTTIAKRRKTEHTNQEKKHFRPQAIKRIKAKIKKRFDAGDELEAILDQYSLPTKINILSEDEYDLFRCAAVRHDVKALNFIVNTVPREIAYSMLHWGGLSSLICFFCNTRTLEKLNKLDNQDRIEGLKAFLKIDLENVMKEFDDFNGRLSQTDPTKDSIRKDFATALIQLREEGIIPIEKHDMVEEGLSEDEYETSRNALLKHLEGTTNSGLGKTKLTLHSITDHTTFNSMATEESISSKLNETTKKARISPNVSSASFKTL